MSKLQVQPGCREELTGRDGPNPCGETNKFTGANGDREEIFFPSWSWQPDPTRLTHHTYSAECADHIQHTNLLLLLLLSSH